MKHPALARVFAIVLAVMAVILIAVGISGISKAIENKKEDTRVYDLLVSRTQEYEELTEKLKAADDIDELESELEKRQSEHQKDKSEHLVNLATYTATRSGISSADEMIMEQMNTMIPGLEINSYTLESFTGLAPVLVWLYPELQDAAVNLQVEVGSASTELRNASALLLDAAADSASFIQENSSQLEEIAEHQGFNAPDEAVVQELVRTAFTNGLNAAGSLNTVADNADSYAKKLVNLVDSYDETVYSIKQYIPQLVQMLDTKAGIGDTKTDLVNSKTKLDKEETEISELESELDELRSYEKRRISLAVLLKTNANIKAACEKGGDVATVAESEIQRSEKALKSSFRMSLTVAVLMIVAGLAAFIGIPAAFEKTRSRVHLVLPVILFTVFSTASELLNEFTVQERQYAAIVAAVMGVIQLLVILPKEELPEDD